MINDDWVECRFDDVVVIISGKNQKKVVDDKGQYPIYGSGGIMGRANDFLCPEGTTIIGRKGTINSPIYVKEKFWNVDTAFGFHPKGILSNRLLYFFCILFNFKKLDKSTTIPSLAKRDLLQIDFRLPPLPIQRAIVSKIETLFSSLDSGIADLKKAQAQLKIYRQAVLKKAYESINEFSTLRESGDWKGGGGMFLSSDSTDNQLVMYSFIKVLKINVLSKFGSKNLMEKCPSLETYPAEEHLVNE